MNNTNDLIRLQPLITKIDRLFAERDAANDLKQNDIMHEINDTIRSGVSYLVHFKHFTHMEATTSITACFPQLNTRFHA